MDSNHGKNRRRKTRDIGTGTLFKAMPLFIIQLWISRPLTQLCSGVVVESVSLTVVLCVVVWSCGFITVCGGQQQSWIHPRPIRLPPQKISLSCKIKNFFCFHISRVRLLNIITRLQITIIFFSIFKNTPYQVSMIGTFFKANLC